MKRPRGEFDRRRCGVLRRAATASIVLGLACTGCPIGSTNGSSIVQIDRLHFLGPEPPHRVDYLARGFLVARTPDMPDFGYYVYLVIRPEATREQRLFAADAFLSYPDATYGELGEDVERERLALIGAPIRHRRVPERAEELVGDYDSGRAELIVGAVERAGEHVPAVALVAHPEPILRNSELDGGGLLVADVCGDRQQVQLKFRRFRDALVSGRRDGAVLRLAERIGRAFLSFSTIACQ